MRNQALINLPPERADQLRQIADRLEKTIVDVVGDLVQEHIRVGTIPDEVPGVATIRSGQTLALGIISRPERVPLVLEGLSSKQACEIADIIDAATTRQKPGGVEIKAGEAKLQIARIGTAVTFAQGDHRRVVAYAVAHDIAAQLRRAADQLDNDRNATPVAA